MGSVIVFHANSTGMERLPVEAATLDAATLQTGHGVYAVIRTYPGNRVVRLGQHLARMRRSAQLLSQPYPHEDEWLRGVLRRAVEASGLSLARVRLTVPFDAPESAVVALEPFHPPPASLYERGVSVGLAQKSRREPRAKDSRFIVDRKALYADQPSGTYEILMYNQDGYIVEGTSSNFYVVLNGELRTPEEGMLEGIARGMLLEAAAPILPVSLGPIHLDDLSSIDETMLTSASRGVIPVVRIGEMTVGAGRPGEVFRRLKAAYDALVERELEPL
jgi:branched-subunit amino acid aminotransferase/4-amino-4-deoxychorismate lyase